MESHTQTHQFDMAELRTEELMASSDQLLKLAMRADPFGTFRLNVAKQEVWWSPNVFKIHGLLPKEGPVDVATAIGAYHPSDAISVGLLIDHAIENRKGFDFILRLNRADGKLRFVQAVAAVEANRAGEVTNVFGIFRDITDRISEKRVSEMNRQLVRSIIANSPAPLIVVDKDMRYMQVSPSWLELHDLGAPHEFEGTSHYETFTNLPTAWKDEHKRALGGEIINRPPSFDPDIPSELQGQGTVIFPWRTTSKKVGGLVMMVTSGRKSQEKDTTAARQIAGLLQQTEPSTVH